ncbi:hypothetical protein MRB53_003041 [Persea americana]|uniref:Uncharacterized protein n=1 Tax=Persea americana TaxID=3435 RepID=A0ACC2MWI3_PERAE|nr:hypothetical protein MRB53_003041 [Persea americana]|eukprot:TRINITY_DN8920_c0_g1_i1.p1 TRINITY_DN8920_c0_g1~~TRINITY_DN8920_c0_g1_i1.p1  ORF type:complete len:130 (-),score=10.89 TRINITY_DN8920_c0_g1_i1:391-780(-)
MPQAPAMVDHPSVCCMCGDIGFPEKLFHCAKCRSRYQHSYCTNYYDESLETTVCDWCRSKKRSGMKHVVPSKRSAGKCGRAMNRSEYSGDKIKRNGSSNDREEYSDHVRGTPSPRPVGRKYKLLKDVLC